MSSIRNVIFQPVEGNIKMDEKCLKEICRILERQSPENQAFQEQINRYIIAYNQPTTGKWWRLRKILVEAVKKGNQRAVSSAIDHGADAILNLISQGPRKENDYAYSLLGFAACYGHHNIINILLKAGVDVDYRGGTIKTPLHIAVERNHVEFARKLIQCGANVEAKSNEEPALTTLHLAVHHGHIECMKLLLEEKANIDSRANWEYTPLHKAASNNQLSAIELLLDSGCNRDARIHLGGTALHVAAMWNNKEAAELLIKRGFDPNLKDNDGHTPKESADVRGHESLSHWLDKVIEGNIEDNENLNLHNIGPHQSIEQTSKSKYSIEFYWADNKKIFEMVDINTCHTLRWKDLRSIPKTYSGYFQDEMGLTALHYASKNGHFDAIKLLIEELDIFPCLKTFNGDGPADIAEREGHGRIAHYLKNAIKQKSVPICSQMELYEQLLTVITTSDNVQAASRLLIQGAPLESYGNTAPSAIALAILWNRVMIIELLLAAGAPLTVTHHGKTLLQVAWFSPDVTMRVKTIIARAYYERLIWEEKKYICEFKLEEIESLYKLGSFKRDEIPDPSPGKEYLRKGVRELMDVLEGETPWQASWKIREEHLNALQSMWFWFVNIPPEIAKSPMGLSLQMGTAAKNNCKLLLFFIQQAGGQPNHRTGLGLTPLHEALDIKSYDLAKVMVKHLGASLYIPDCDGRYPRYMMPKHMIQQLEKEQVASEFNKIDKLVLSARTETEKAELKEIALALVCLYITFTKQWDHALCNWQNLHCYLISLIQAKNESGPLDFKSNDNKTNRSKHYIWIKSICQNLNQLNKKEQINNLYDEIGFLNILSCIEDLSNTIKVDKKVCNIIQCEKNCDLKNVSTQRALVKSVKLATENSYRTFLHLLFTIGGQSFNIPLNDMIQTLPLHHAAAAGNFCAILYLTLTCGGSLNVLDRNRNTPAHLAYMNGYIYSGDYICYQDKNVESVKNNSGQTPQMLKKAFRNYEKLYDIEKDEDKNDPSVNLTEQIDGLSLSTKLLEHWLSKVKNKSFRSLMNDSKIDYSYGENKLVLSLITDFARSIGCKISEYNPLLKGTLIPVGSAGDNVRLNAPDESDCTWILEWNNVKVHLDEMSHDDQNIKHYKHVIRAESDNPEIQYLLEGTNLLEEFYKQCVKAVSNLVSGLDPRLSLILPGVKRIGCGVCITLAWAGTTYPMLIVKVDLAPAFKASRPANFPRKPLTKNINDPKLVYIYVVQTHINAGEKRCSTTLEEQIVMLRLSSEQHLIFIIAKLLVSKLKTESWASKLHKKRFTFFSTKQFQLPAPTGFLLKSAFFRELEKVTDPEDWTESHIVDRLQSIFYSMCILREETGTLDSGLVPSYFSSTTQPPAAGFMAPAIYRFLVNNEEVLRKMEDSSSHVHEAKELERIALMWNEVLNKYYYIP